MNVPVDTPMADVNAWGWQGSTKTIKDRTAYMLNHSPIPFNVKFEVHLSEEVAVTIIEAHKDVLAAGSEVFHAMFYGGLIDSEQIIDISDTDPRAFRLMLRFLYTEELSTDLMEIDIAVAFEVMKCAGKYGIPYLYIQCRQWILEHCIDYFGSVEKVKTDALWYLRLALKAEYADPKILEEIWNIIDVCAESVLQTPDEVLRKVSLDLLTVFLARDSLTVIKEKNLYDFMVRWAELQTSPSETTDLTLRQRLGDSIKNIRYTQIDLSEFANGPVADKILTFEEAVTVYQHQFAPATVDELPFISRPRKKTAAPTMLAIGTRFFDGGDGLKRICEYDCFVDSTIQIAELHPALMRLVKNLNSSILRYLTSATWSFVEDSVLSTLTVRFGNDFRRFTDDSDDDTSRWEVHVEDEQQQLLKESVGQVVSLGFGDVAMEMAYSGHEAEDADDEETTMYYSLDSFSLIFGGYSKSTYASVNKSNSVFYLGHVTSGTADFSFLRRFVKPGKFFPALERIRFFTKYFEENGPSGGRQNR